MEFVYCEQKCGNRATVYAGDSIANGWAGCYCVTCSGVLGFSVWNVFPNGIIQTELGKVGA
jgi:hypothetical protein